MKCICDSGSIIALSCVETGQIQPYPNSIQLTPLKIYHATHGQSRPWRRTWAQHLCVPNFAGLSKPGPYRAGPCGRGPHWFSPYGPGAHDMANLENTHNVSETRYRTSLCIAIIQSHITHTHTIMEFVVYNSLCIYIHICPRVGGDLLPPAREGFPFPPWGCGWV
jgi:hypothetical protein